LAWTWPRRRIVAPREGASARDDVIPLANGGLVGLGEARSAATGWVSSSSRCTRQGGDRDNFMVRIPSTFSARDPTSFVGTSFADEGLTVVAHRLQQVEGIRADLGVLDRGAVERGHPSTRAV